jgi:protein-disulfide isomerase
MSLSPRTRLSRPTVIALGLALAGLVGGSYAWYRAMRPADPVSAELARAGIDPGQRVAIEGLVRAYILDHPEILPEAMDRLQARETADRLKPVRAALETPFPGAVLGNPAGTVTLVEFSDFSCTYCRGSVADIQALIAANPDLKVVLRELPIIGPESDPAARMALAAAAQGKYAAYHDAMFAGPRPDAASIASAASHAGVNLDTAHSFARRPEVQKEIETNLGYAHQLGINGTPAFAIGGQIIPGAVGRETLQKAVDAARKG